MGGDVDLELIKRGPPDAALRHLQRGATHKAPLDQKLKPMLGVKPPPGLLAAGAPGPPLSIVVDCSKNFFRPSETGSSLPRSVVLDEPGAAISQSSTLSLVFGSFFACALCAA